MGDVIASAFQSAGQRCSALRVLYVQEDVAPHMLEMLYGAMDELAVTDPWDVSADAGPVIDADALQTIRRHVESARGEGRILKEMGGPARGTFCAPVAIRISGIGDLEREIFGPVLHVATFSASQIDAVIDAVNASGFGLTFGLHSRIDDRVEHVTSRIRAGNLYINRNQIGAVVGSQPFGGEGLSGTGPKAGGPQYLDRFVRSGTRHQAPAQSSDKADPAAVQALLDAAVREERSLSTTAMPGVTGESNRLSVYPRGAVLCLGPTAADASAQAVLAAGQGCLPVIAAAGASGANAVAGFLERDNLATIDGIDAVMLWSDAADLAGAARPTTRRTTCPGATTCGRSRPRRTT